MILDRSEISILEDNLKNMYYALNSDGFCLNHVTLNVTCVKTKKHYLAIMNDDKNNLIWEIGGETDEKDKTIEVR